MSIVDRALEWARAGYYVYPVYLYLDTEGKKVIDFPGNWRESVRDPEDVKALFQKHSNHSGIAVDTGKSGVVVIDIDNSGDKDGLGNLKKEGLKLPTTPMIGETWSGGFHGFFRQPEERVGSGQNRPVRYVDFRGDGGVVFVDPTVVYDVEGRAVGQYAVKPSIRAVGDLPTLDESFASRLRKKPSETKLGVRTAPRGWSTLRDDQRESLEGFIEQDLHVIRTAVSGARNEALGRTLFLADRYRKLGHTFGTFLADVSEAYEESGGDDPDQVLNWCRSSWRKSEEEPMTVPPTEVDHMADNYQRRLIAQRLARARVSGATAKLVDESSFVDWSATPPPAEFWVAGVIPKGEQIVLYGRPEAGKTFTALDWGLSIALGVPWFGRETETGRAWFLAGEGNARITTRIHAWIEHHGRKPDSGQFRLLNHVPDLMNDQVIEQMSQRIAEDEVDVGFIDTLGRAMAVGGGDISSPPDAAQALRSLQSLSKYRPQFTPIVIHHPVKEGSMAGAYNLLAGVDVALHAEVGVDTPGMGTLRFEKNKDGEKTTVCTYRWKSSGGSAVLIPAFGPAVEPDRDPSPLEDEDDERWRREHG